MARWNVDIPCTAAEYARLKRVQEAAVKMIALRDRPHGFRDNPWYEGAFEEMRCALTDDLVDEAALDDPVEHWDSDPTYPVASWQEDVANGDTRLNYQEWIEAQRDDENEVVR